MRERGFQQHIGADHVGVDEIGRAIDRAVDMALRRQMHDGIGIEASKRFGDGRTIADVGAAETKARMVLHRSERGEIAGIGQLVDDEHVVLGVADQMPHQRRSDKTRAAGNHNLHARFLRA